MAMQLPESVQRQVDEVLRGTSTAIDSGLDDLGDEGAAALAGALRHATQLQSLNLFGNDIGPEGAAALADALRHATQLQSLDLSSNSIGSEGAAALAGALRHATQLQSLDLRRNRIGSEGAAALARSLAEAPPPRLERLEGIYLREHLAVMGVPVEFQRANNAKILAFLRERHRAGAVRIAILKVIVSGPEYCGKTCLVRRLITGAFDAHTDMTDGVEIVRRLPQEADDGLGIEMVFFDFGGQEVYRISHRLFLRTRAVFLVMWDTRDGLQSVHEYARDVLDATPKGPLIFVSSKADLEGTAPMLEEAKRLRSKYGSNFFGYYHVSARRERDAGTAILFRQGILKAAKTLDHVIVEVPRTYVELRRALEVRRNDVFSISRDEYNTEATAVGLDDEQADTALMLFDAWGYVQRLPHLDDENAAGPIVLQPEQLAGMLSQIITAHSDKVKNCRHGIFRHDEAERVWRDFDASLHPHFIKLIHDCGLGIAITAAAQEAEGEPETYPATLIPSMLEAPTDYRCVGIMESLRRNHPGLKENAPCRLVLDSLPRKLTAQLLVRLRFLLTMGGWWRDGCVLVMRGSDDRRVVAFARLEFDTRHAKSVSIQSFGSCALRMRVLGIVGQLRTDIFPGIQFRALELGDGRMERCVNGTDHDVVRWMEEQGLAMNHVPGRGAESGASDLPDDGTLSQVEHILAQEYATRDPQSAIQQALLPLWMPLIDDIDGCEAGRKTARALWIVCERQDSGQGFLGSLEARAVRPTSTTWKLDADAVALPSSFPADPALAELGKGLVMRMGLELPDRCRVHGVLTRSLLAMACSVDEHVVRVENRFVRLKSFPGVAMICVHKDDVGDFREHTFYVERQEDKADIAQQIAETVSKQVSEQVSRMISGVMDQIREVNDEVADVRSYVVKGTQEARQRAEAMKDQLARRFGACTTMLQSLLGICCRGAHASTEPRLDIPVHDVLGRTTVPPELVALREALHDLRLPGDLEDCSVR